VILLCSGLQQISICSHVCPCYVVLSDGPTVLEVRSLHGMNTNTRLFRCSERNPRLGVGMSGSSNPWAINQSLTDGNNGAIRWLVHAVYLDFRRGRRRQRGLNTDGLINLGLITLNGFPFP
jgi:hypothetical protein